MPLEELPEEAFISSEELRCMWEESGRGGRDKLLPVVTISFCWDSREHPDPKGLQLKLIADTLEADSGKYAAYGFKDMGVFWDWLSLFQGNRANAEAAKEAALNEGKSEEEAKQAKWAAFRTKTEKAAFDHALHKTMDLWYAHQGTTVFLLTQHPRERDSAREKGYEESGWPTYERCSSEQIKKVYRYHAQWPAVMDLGGGRREAPDDEQEEERAVGRRWPVGPDTFDNMIASRSFTNGADAEAVKTLFRDMSRAQLGGVDELFFTGMPPPSREDAAGLIEGEGRKGKARRRRSREEGSKREGGKEV